MTLCLREIICSDIRFTVLYRSIFDAVRDFLQDAALEGRDRILNKYLKPDLLIIDDMGIKNLSRIGWN